MTERKAILSGNAAIARGFYEAGVWWQQHTQVHQLLKSSTV